MGHPLDEAFAGLHPNLKRVTQESLETKVAATLLVVGLTSMAVDVFLEQDGDRILCTSAGPVPPVVLAGVGVSPDGRLLPHAIGAGPCDCSTQEDDRWNPLAVAVVWIPELRPIGTGISPLMRQVVDIQHRMIAEHMNRYCHYGLQALSSMLESDSV